MSPWEHFTHQADIGIRGLGESLESAFEQAALALTAVITGSRIRPLAAVQIRCAAPDPELLLVDWLNQILYESATRGMLFGKFRVSIIDTRLQGEAWGEPVQVARHQPAVEVKGATYTELQVRELPDGRWLAQCVVDV